MGVCARKKTNKMSIYEIHSSCTQTHLVGVPIDAHHSGRRTVCACAVPCDCLHISSEPPTIVGGSPLSESLHLSRVLQWQSLLEYPRISKDLPMSFHNLLRYPEIYYTC